MHRLDPIDREIDQGSARHIEDGEKVEIPGQAESVHDRCRNEAAEQVARYIAGDVGGKCAARLYCAALLPEIGERQRECGCHAKPLRNAKDCEDSQAWRNRKQAGRNGQKNQAGKNAEPVIDMRAEEAHYQPRKRHAHGASVDRKAHSRGRDTVVPRQERQDCLRCEQVDEGQESGRADHDRPPDAPDRTAPARDYTRVHFR
jgi:hypothetical protein